VFKSGSLEKKFLRIELFPCFIVLKRKSRNKGVIMMKQKASKVFVKGLIGLVLVSGFIFGFRILPERTQAPSQPNKDVRAGAWLEKAGIQIAPIYLDSTDTSLHYLSLDEASKAGLVEVTETSSINELRIENKGKKPVLLLAGEIVSGGKQDRIVGKDMILGPGKTRGINVFCVEHGRWSYSSGQTEKLKSSGYMADKRVRQTALKGGGEAENQGEVWSIVGRKLRSYEAASPTENYREILKSEKARDNEGTIKFFIEAFEKDKDIAGFALAFNGLVESIEYFKNPELLSKYKDKLIRSYVLSALDKLKDSAPVEQSKINEFLNQDVSGETHQYKTDDEILIEYRSDTLEAFELQTPDGKPVHYARYQK
jgi:hypothetical protein